ncbi:E3 ubiquitin-protein ligase Os03g0188200-like [Curcuma longa]|uniref:E3 ubiquitin-protein ligase Os03g0188200-like n=1 Tax=Curcuma longa TaxID=136217 RepID=UPI003D9E1F11
MIHCQKERKMNVMVDYCCASHALIRFLKQTAFLLSLVSKWFLFPCYDAWWLDSSSPEGDGKGAEARERHRAAARAVRMALRVATYGELVAEQEAAASCAVCLCRVEPGDRVRELRSCRHVFHRRCLDRWLDHDERLSCPLCRAPLFDRPGTSVQPSPPPPAQPSWAVERLLYLFGDDVLLADLHHS